ncbi:MAG: FAD-binding oxidoreductase [Bacillota bacterium]
MNELVDAVIIGGGIHGCAIACSLAQKSRQKILLLEKKYLAAGATGRCAAGIRQQFGTEINIRLATASIKKFEQLQDELDYHRNVGLLQHGYLMLAYSQSELKQYQENALLQKQIDANNQTSLLGVDEISEMVPQLNLKGVVGASYNPKDGHVDPFLATDAYATAARRRGVEIRTDTEVTDILLQGERVCGVVTHKGEIIHTPVVVNAAGAFGSILGKKVGIDLPLYPERHQLLVSEPLEMFLGPTIISFFHGACFKQTPQGSLILGVGDPQHEIKALNERSSWQFLGDVARKLTYHMPLLENISVIRQWAGLYDMTPDAQGIVGETGIEGFYLDLGWSGHGFQLAPAIGQIMAEIICGEKPFIDVRVLSLERFARGELIPEPYCV